MTRYITIIALVICGCALLTSAQYNHFGFADNYLATNFGPPSFGGLSSAAPRDPRADRGPVLFPSSPPGEPDQTSGVVIGGSGYGFQAPGSRGPVVPRYFYRGFYGRR